MKRRDLVIGGACLTAVGAAYALKPRKRLILLAEGKMASLLPLTLDDWSAENADGLVQPKSEDSLAAALYSEMVGRIYHEASTGKAVMMLVAYGDTQSDLLQLHRPETCYPALGFNLVSTKATELPLPGGLALPVRRVVATTRDRQENIVYWTRMGEYLPRSGGEQREVRLRTAIAGYIPDGALIRFSVIGNDESDAFALMNRFILKLLEAIPTTKRKALIGTQLSMSMKG